MTIANIDTEKCIECGECTLTCPMDVIRKDGETPKITYLNDCQTCYLCRDFCPVTAITVSKVRNEKPMTGWG